MKFVKTEIGYILDWVKGLNGFFISLFTIAAIVAVIFGCVRLSGMYAGSGSPPGIRGTISGAWHHTKCLVRICDDEGRCPAWSGIYGKCYMLDGEGAEILRKAEKDSCSREAYETKGKYCVYYKF